MRATAIMFILLLMAGCAHEATEATPPHAATRDWEVVTGKVESVTRYSQHDWLPGATGHGPDQFFAKVDVRITTPEKLAGLTQRFVIFLSEGLKVTDPTDPDETWKGRMVTVRLGKEEAEKSVHYIRTSEIKVVQ